MTTARSSSSSTSDDNESIDFFKFSDDGESISTLSFPHVDSFELFPPQRHYCRRDENDATVDVDYNIFRFTKNDFSSKSKAIDCRTINHDDTFTTDNDTLSQSSASSSSLLDIGSIGYDDLGCTEDFDDSFFTANEALTFDFSSEDIIDNIPLFKHVDSFDVYDPKSDVDDSTAGTGIEWRRENIHEIETTASANKFLPRNIFNPSAIAFTNHLYERLYERGFTKNDCYKVIRYGCRYQEGGDGHWRFTYKRATVITDSDVEVVITIYQRCGTNCVRCDSKKDLCACGYCKGCCDSSDESNPSCPDCGRRGVTLCDRGYCRACCFGCGTCTCPSCHRKTDKCDRGYCADCCWGCDQCIGDQCPKCKARGVDILCDLGMCADCCDGCVTCAGQVCPQCRQRGLGILCSRGYCKDCCFGCIDCRCPSCRRKTETCDRGFCSDCCWGCAKCR